MYYFWNIFSSVFTLIIVHFYPNVKAQPFEGRIAFVRESMTDTTYFNYYVKGKTIRVDDLDKNHKLIKFTLYSLDDNTIKVVNPDKKLYKSSRSNPYVASDNNGYEIQKTPNTKDINSYKCSQWLVKNLQAKTFITYWVANDNFSFFNDFLKLMNKTEKASAYYLQIPDSNGFIPMETEERSNLRELRMRMAVVTIKKEKLDDKLFSIPKDYSAVDHQ